MKEKRRRFQYQQRSPKDVEERAKQQGGAFDSIFDGTFEVYKVEDKNRLRILPPTWENARHYGTDLWIHFGVGPDKQKYLCGAKMERGGRCPVCDEARQTNGDGETDLRPKRQVLLWVIDREDESSGPKLYTMPWTLDRDISKLSQEEDSKSYIMIDDPEEGYDVTFEREGSGLTTKYGAVRIARKPTPISSDQKQQEEWLEYITDHPLPNILKVWPYEHIRDVFRAVKDSDEEEPEREVRTREDERRPVRKDDEDDEPPYRSGKGPRDDPPRTPRNSARDDEESDPDLESGQRDPFPLARARDRQESKSRDREERPARTERRARSEDGDNPRSLRDLPDDKIPFDKGRRRDPEEEEDIRDRVRKGLAGRKDK